MAKYIDADKLIEKILRLQKEYALTEVKEDNKAMRAVLGGQCYTLMKVVKIIQSLQDEQTDMGEVSDGYHTFNELYYYRMLYNAAFFNLLPKEWVHKSKRHHTGEECFGGGWFVVMANLPTGQVANHYELKDWGLFKVPEKEFADEWDGHTPQEAAERLHKYLQQEQPEVDLKKEVKRYYSDNYSYITSDQPTLSILTNIARHFAEWKEEQLMKNAKDGWVDEECVIILNDDTRIDLQPDYEKKPAFEFKYAQDVRVIVLPKEDEK